MKILTFLFGALMIFSLPSLAQAQSASQCTTSELDLVCPNGEVLTGIASDGKKICAHPNTLIVWPECRVCIQIADRDNCSRDVGPERCTDWVALGGYKGWARSDWAEDGLDAHDPDCARVTFQCQRDMF